MSAYGYIFTWPEKAGERRKSLAGLKLPADHLFIDEAKKKDDARPEYGRLKEHLRSGDVLFLRDYYDLGDNFGDMLGEWESLTKDQKIDVVLTKMPKVDTRGDKKRTGNNVGDMVSEFLSFAASAEWDTYRDRRDKQRRGIEEAKAKGVKFGKPREPLSEEFYLVCDRFLAGEISGIRAAEKLGMNKVTFYRRAERYRQEKEELTNVKTGRP